MVLSILNFCCWAYAGLCEAWGDGHTTLWERPRKEDRRVIRRGLWAVLAALVCTLEAVTLSVGWEQVFLLLFN